MHKQRIWIGVIAGFGMLTAFLPWFTLFGLVGVTPMDLDQGWIVLGIFAVALVVAMTGSRAYALDGARQGVLSVLGLAASGFGIWKYLQIKDGKLDLGGELGQQFAQATGTGSSGKELGNELGKGMMKMLGGAEGFEMSFGIYALIGTGLLLVVAALLKRRAA